MDTLYENTKSIHFTITTIPWSRLLIPLMPTFTSWHTYTPIQYPLSIAAQNGWTAVQLAARYGFLHVVRELVEVCHADYKCAKPVSSSQHHMLLQTFNCLMHSWVFHSQCLWAILCLIYYMYISATYHVTHTQSIFRNGQIMHNTLFEHMPTHTHFTQSHACWNTLVQVV